MKRTLKALSVIMAAAILSLSVICLAGCGKSESVKAVEAVINEIGDVTLNSAEAIQKAKEAFVKLSPEEKEKVSNQKKLRAADEEYKKVKAVDDDIAAIVKTSTVTFSSDDFKVSESIKKIEDVKKRYGELNKNQQETIKDYDKLDAAEKKLQSYVDNAKKAAVQYVKAFMNTEKGKNATITAVYCIKQIRNETDEYHFMALTYKKADGKERDVYSCARFTPEVSVEAINSHEETFFANEAVSDNGNAKKNGNIVLNAEEIVAACK